MTEGRLGASVVSPRMGKEGWPFNDADSFPGADVDTINHAQHVKDLYHKASSDYSGRFTVPVLWDKKNDTIVNNESSEIIRFLNTAFNHLLPAEMAELDLYPESLRKEIDGINDWVYTTVNSPYTQLSSHIRGN